MRAIPSAAIAPWAVAGLLCAGLIGQVHAADYPPLFTSETKALAHCPGDVVVWIDPTIAVYRLKGQKGYAKTNRGAYACKADADRAGAHPAAPGGSGQ